MTQPYRTLLVCLVIQALREATARPPKKATRLVKERILQDREDAIQWFMSKNVNHPSDGTGITFEWAAHMLGIDPERTRLAVLSGRAHKAMRKALHGQGDRS